MTKKINIFFLTFFYIGKIKYAPGTFASLTTCFLFLVFVNFLDFFTLFFLTLIIFLYSLLAINNSVESFDSDDPKEIVIDEFVGQMIPLLAIPVYETLFIAPKLYYCVACFLLFRLFDVWKPYPINYIDENTKGALGIMLDDIVAGVFTVITISLFLFFLGA